MSEDIYNTYKLYHNIVINQCKIIPLNTYIAQKLDKKYYMKKL